MSSVRSVFGMLTGVPALPVVAFNTVEDALPLSKSLLNGGLRAIEVTLRTPCAFEAIALLIRELPQAIVGVGTITSVEQLRRVKDLGAAFAISPGLTPALLREARDLELPYLAGVASASEIMSGLEFGYDEFKFFPASIAGGPEALKAFAGPFPDVSFCPTGGINPQNAGDYLACPNVRIVGSSWMLPAKLIADKRWSEVESRSRQFVDAIRQVRTGEVAV